MNELIDPEFGVIKIRRLANARHIRLRLLQTGEVAASLPRSSPVRLLQNLLDSSRPALRKARAQHALTAPPVYHDGMRIGASHRIVLQRATPARARLDGQNIHWNVPTGDNEQLPAHQAVVRAAVRRALDVEAKAYLPRRLSYLATMYGFRYHSIRYSNAKGRWGSCSSRGVISLNVALMNLPMELVDYVLLHELAHTTHLNHSPSFWAEVERCYANYNLARKDLKKYNPYL